VSDTKSDIILDRLMKLHPKAIDLTLDRVTRLLGLLGNPQQALPPVIHVAGTNGKGSTLAMIRAGLEATGSRVHAYTSPHLARFHERIRLAGELIGETLLAETLKECETANGGAPITYFEITTCAAFLAFSRVEADHILLEVGLGGHLDATNVIDDPAMTVITPVSIDHQRFLGNTIARIAAEKAGILKRNTFAVIGPQEEAAEQVITAQAARVGATCKIHGRHWHVWEECGRLLFQDETGLWDLPPPALIGAHQVQNAGAAIAVLRLMGLPEEAAAAALTNAQWPARMQRLRDGPLVAAAGAAELWLDGGHNPAAGVAVAEALGRLPARPLHLICGMLNTKDARGYMKPLAGVADSLTAVPIRGETATLDAAETCAAARCAGLKAREADSVFAAVVEIAARAPGTRILICGSLALAGRVLEQNG